LLKNKISLFLISLLAFSLPASAGEAPIATASLISDKTAITPGQPFRIALFLDGKLGWHTYWENPGDAGLATTIEWTLPEGFTAETIDWPVPRRIPEGPLVVYGYDDDVFLPVAITPPDTLDMEEYTFHVKANWLICETICIPESAELDIRLPVGNGEAATDTSLFTAHDAALPTVIPFPINYSASGKTITLSAPLSLLGVNHVTDVSFFPRIANVIHYAADQSFSVVDGQLQVILERSSGTTPATFSGLLTVISDSGKKIFDIHLERKETAGTEQEQPQQKSLWALMLLALTGGLILNLMPCVLPVLSLKALAVVKKAGGERKLVRLQGLTYTLGILFSFTLFAGLLLLLKSGGQAIGWGFQMQSPAFVGFLIYLLFLVGLSLSGFFHLPVLLGNVGSNIIGENSPRGSFLTGMLATAVATPCTAPFMAPAVGAALLLPSWKALLIFEALGLGLALPFLLVSFFPVLLRFLPKPGAWMETFKHILAWPMYLSVLWLLWVLWQQTGMGGIVVTISAMTLFCAMLWAKKFIAQEKLRRIVMLALFTLLFGATLPWLGFMEKTMAMPKAAVEEGVEAVPFSKETLDELVAAGRPVFVDATAAWCITCQVNARIAIHTDATMKAFKDRGVTLMVADWTRRNAEITEFLASFGHQGVPLYVFYPAGGEPKILPQLLTESIVIDSLN